MAIGIEMRPENEPNFSKEILFVDDNLFVDDKLYFVAADVYGMSDKFDGLTIKPLYPDELVALTETDLDGVSLIIVDQFFDNRGAFGRVSSFLENMKNRKIPVIEISYIAHPPVYSGSVGILDKSELEAVLEKAVIEWPKTAPAFVSKLIWESNYGFRQAQGIDHSGWSEDRTGYLEKSYNRLLLHTNFHKFLEVAGITEQQFIQSFGLRYKNEDINKRCALLHSAWQIIGHLSIGSSEEFYSMSLQRLKEVILPEDPDLYIAR